MTAVTIFPQWLDELSMDRYRPMLRLLSAEDFQFLRTQPGFTPRMATEVRIQRCRIFHGYLRALESDFAIICAILAFVMPGTDLRRYRMLFALGVAAVRVRVWLYRWGLGAVDTSGIVQLFEMVRKKLRVPLAAVR
jgi:hypothetical protein